MKKMLWLVPFFLLGLMLALRKAPVQENAPRSAPTSVAATPLPAPTAAAAEIPAAAPVTASAPSVTPEPDPNAKVQDWMDLLAGNQLTPKALEDWARSSGTSLKRETKGHAKSGQRLELSWGEEPTTTAVFDSMGGDQYQLSAVRSLYQKGTSLSDLKKMLEYKFHRPIDREDAQSLVFAADAQGLVIWAAQQEDGCLKVAFEYGAHTHDGESL